MLVKHWQWLCTCLCLCVQINFASATTTDEEDLAQVYGDKSFLTIATGARTPYFRAPSVASVITAEDIKAMGAIDLDEVLQTLPGLHVSRSHITNAPIYTIRGIRSAITNPQVLMLVNGVPMNIVYDGGRGNVWGGMPLENVARIEVIRGPGSALYGADAFSGVINITTKTAQEINGTQVGTRIGNHQTYDEWLLHGKKYGDLDVAGYLRLGSTEGSRPIISADAASSQASGVSRAPGPINNERDAIDANLDLGYQKWRLRFGYKQRDNIGSGAGVAQALDPTGKNDSERITSDLTYNNTTLGKHWGLELQASYLHYKEFSDLTLFPAGSNLGGGTFSAGMIGNPYKWERHHRLNGALTYSGFAKHRIRIGSGFTKENLYRIRETKNFQPTTTSAFTPIGTGSLADVTDVSASTPFIRPHKRMLRYLYVQDEWRMANDWTLTTGVRHDKYSDFSATTNPRAALVWAADYNVTAKLLYGSAYRAPAFAELYAVNNPTAFGNNTLRPEKINTVEAALSWQPTGTLQLGMNVFHYRMRDIISLVNNTYQNTGRQHGKGLELEATWDATRAVHLSGNYAYQRSTDQTTHRDAGLAPHHRLYMRADWRFTTGWLASTQLNWVAGRKREPGDTRPHIADYTTVDMTLRSQNTRAPWDIAFSVRNLFNVDAREPSAGTAGVVSIPNDLPLPKRTFFIELHYKL